MLDVARILRWTLPAVAPDVAVGCCSGHCSGCLVDRLHLRRTIQHGATFYRRERHRPAVRPESPRLAPTVQPWSNCSLPTAVPLRMCGADARASLSAGVIRSRRRCGPVRPRCIGRQHDFANNATVRERQPLSLFGPRRFRIFCVLGTVTDANWRGAADLPDFQSRIRPPAPAQRVLRAALQSVRFGTPPTSTAMAAHASDAPEFDKS